MKKVIASTATLMDKTDENVSAESAKKKWIIILYFCSFGGIIVGLSGLCFSGLAFFNLVENANHFHKLGTRLIIVAFPLIMIGAYAVNKLGKISQVSKSER